MQLLALLIKALNLIRAAGRVHLRHVINSSAFQVVDVCL